LKHLILPGGGIKGSWQAGVVNELIDRGFEPDVIKGVSVGALNAAYMTSLAGKYKDEPNLWDLVSQDLVAMWEDRITGFGSMAKKRSWYKLLWHLSRKKFVSMYDMKPLDKLAYEIMDNDLIYESPVEFECGAVNLKAGKYESWNNQTEERIDLIARTLASTRIPIGMPLQNIGGNFYYDGSVREVAPLGRCVEEGATEIVIVPCHTHDLRETELNVGSILNLVSRVVEIMVNEILNNDIDKFVEKNEIAKTSDKYKHIDITIIRPTSPLRIDMEKFDKIDIETMIDEGAKRTAEVLEGTGKIWPNKSS
jgi:NTE family protein